MSKRVEAAVRWQRQANRALDAVPLLSKEIIKAVLSIVPVTHNLLRYSEPYFDILESNKKSAPVILRFHFEFGRAVCDFVADNYWHIYRDLCSIGVFAPLGFKGSELSMIRMRASRRAALRAAAEVAGCEPHWYGAFIRSMAYVVKDNGDYVRCHYGIRPGDYDVVLGFGDVLKRLGSFADGATPTVVVDGDGATGLYMRSGTRYVSVHTGPFWTPKCYVDAGDGDADLRYTAARWLRAQGDDFHFGLIDVERR